MGDTYSWNGGAGDFGDPNQWTDDTNPDNTGVGSPGPDDNAIFDADGSVSGSGDVSILDIYADITFMGDFSAEQADNLGFLTISSGSLSVTSGGLGDSGSIIISGGASANLMNADPVLTSLSLGNGYDGTILTVTGSGSSLTTSGGGVDVGVDGSGTLSVLDGATFTASEASASYFSIAAGFYAGDQGLLTVDGSGSTLELLNQGLDIGGAGDGTLVVSGGGSIMFDAAANNFLNIAQEAGSTGTVTVTDSGSSIYDNGVIVVGDGGDGTMTIENDGTVSSQGGEIGEQAGAQGTVMVVGPALWDVTSGYAIHVGDAGTGSLLVQNGGTVTDTAGAVGPGRVDVGASAGGVGTLTVEDTGSQLTAGALIVGGTSDGPGGTGTVIVRNEGSVEVATLLAYSGTGTVDGSGSALSVTDSAILAQTGTVSFTVSNSGSIDVTNSMTIGESLTGVGTLAITTEGSVTIGTDLDIAADASTLGTVTVDGKGSTLDVTGTVTVGDAGTGTIAVTNGASATAGDLIVAAQSTSGSAASPDGVTVDGNGSSLIVDGDATVDGAMPTPTNADGDPNGTCGEWSYTDSGIGTIIASNGGYISIGQTLTLLAPADTTLPAVLTVQSGGGVEVGGNSGPQADTLVVDAGGLIVGHGTIAVGNAGAGGFTNGTIANDGTIEAMDGTLVLKGDVNGGGTAQIDDNSTLEVSGTFSGDVLFNGAYQTTLKLDQPNPTDFTGTIGGLQPGDVIDIPLTALPGGVAHTDIEGSDLDLTFSSGTVWQYQLAGDYSDDSFDVIDTEPTGATGAETDLSLVLQADNPEITTGVNGAPTANPYINSLIWGWGAWDPSAGPITYWFGAQGDVQPDVLVHGETQFLDCNSNVDAWTAQEETDFTNALRDYSSVCGLTFAPASSAETADVVWWLDPTIAAASALGYSEVPAQVSGGQLWQYFNDTPWNGDPNQLSFGGDGNNTIVHELGHTLGLAHPHDGGSEPDATTFPGVPLNNSASLGLNDQNQAIYTIMSYNEGWNGDAPYPPPLDYGTQGALGAFDIASLQELYGANDSATLDNQTFTLPTVNAAGTGWSSIWAPGGVNTITAGGTDLDCTIDLRPAPLTGPNAGGFVSWATGILGGFTIANGSEVDNAIGGTGDDTFYVNADADTITGGGGSDTVVFPDDLSAYTLSRVGTVVSVTMDGVTDTLNQITTLQFADKSILAASIACFAAGTCILTDRGDVAVEQLREGDQVRTLSGGLRPVRWIGRRRIDLTRHPDPDRARPIRIQADAFADGQPKRDLLVSPEHAIWCDGLLVAARLLRNDATIASDERSRCVEYFHVELDMHDILLAEGLPAESYLDTGNRGMFENASEPLILDPFRAAGNDQALRERLSCAPLVDDGARVEPIWRRLAIRASMLGHAIPGPATTDDPALRLSVNGREIWPTDVAAGRYRFDLPPLAAAVRLVSRATAPCELTPWVEDRRPLGVRVGRVVITGADRSVDLMPDDPALVDGWWEPERDDAGAWRWTDGGAVLRLPEGARMLDVHLAGGMTHLLDAGSAGRADAA